MSALRFLLLLPLCALLSSPMAAQAQVKPKTPPPPAPKPYADVKNNNFRKELTALDEAAALLAEVNDEKSAKEATRKIERLFRNLPPLLGGNGRELDLLAKAQNRVSAQMWRMKNEPYFETMKLQELWTLITDQFSRPSASK